jgi:hypothetical protein
MNVDVFWDVAPCSPYVNQRFGETYHLHLQLYADYTTLYPRKWQRSKLLTVNKEEINKSMTNL